MVPDANAAVVVVLQTWGNGPRPSTEGRREREFDSARERRARRARNKRDTWTFVTMNTTSQVSGELALCSDLVASADIIAWQEHKTPARGLSDLRYRMRQAGWNACAPPCLTPSGGPATAGRQCSGGVALLTSKHIGHEAPTFLPSSVLESGRIVLRHVHAVIPGEIGRAHV